MHNNHKCWKQSICIDHMFSVNSDKLGRWANVIWKTCQGHVFRSLVNFSTQLYELSPGHHAARKDKERESV